MEQQPHKYEIVKKAMKIDGCWKGLSNFKLITHWILIKVKFQSNWPLSSNRSITDKLNNMTDLPPNRRYIISVHQITWKKRDTSVSSWIDLKIITFYREWIHYIQFMFSKDWDRDRNHSQPINSIDQYFMENELQIDNSLCHNDENTFLTPDTK